MEPFPVLQTHAPLLADNFPKRVVFDDIIGFSVLLPTTDCLKEKCTRKIHSYKLAMLKRSFQNKLA